ncbi:serine/threonine-protein kinase/endoribonuclease IRE1b-like isoform X1 [Camellia sinensis]|uniref:non-specific serine/threonine protein kinase n=1 Tax=Camellia sinensis var. sinensis TaxID=542762 RepID=A0A4V3WMJ0_CAMSN|nr:serine/threonine-protein kinase/endoribonuclease IRE1b-like isoform X1 [Camellia sinensis]THG08827.1 hypothetical protein TEA_024278 [Camellia sinensis var. sinensis]
MKRVLMICTVCFFFSAISGGLSTSISDLNREEEGVDMLKPAPTTSLLPVTPKHNTALVAALDGTIYLVETNSRKILWSFTSGPSIYSSYQALPPTHDSDNRNDSELQDFFIDCGDDWELYVHGPGYKKSKLPMSAEEFIKRTPIISADGGVLLGSKNTTAFLVDAKSGAVIYAFGSADHSAIGAQSAEENAILPRKDVEGWVESEVEQPLFVIRTDYVLKYFSRKTGKELWYLRFAEIETSFQCQEAGNYFGEGSPNPEDDFGPELKGDDELPLTCQRRAVVYRIRDHSLLEQLLGSDRLPNTHLGGRLPPLPAPDLNPLLKPLARLSEVHQNKAGKVVLALPPPETEDFGILSLHRGGSGKMYTNVAPEIVHQNKAGQVVLALPPPKTEDFGILSLHRGGACKMYTSVAPEILAASHMWYFVVFVVLLSFIVAFLFYVSPLAVVEKVKLNKWSEEGKVQAMMSKKKKARKSGIHKNSAGIEPSWEDVSHETMVGDTNGLLENPHVERTVRKSQLTFFNPVDGSIDGRKIGKLFVTNKEIAKGSNGTIVLEGIYDGRPVAVKRLVRTHHDVALKEIQNLIASDFHPNIVRWYGVEFDQDFVYLSLERCTCNLGELIFSYSCTLQNQIKNKDQDPNFFDECTTRLHSTVENKDFELWKANGHPSSQLLKLMRDIVSGLAHLHELGIIHRDLKPQNVLIIKGRSICAKLSDMGISKRLPGNMSSLTQSATGCGSSGWQAPEQLRHERQTRAVDLFGLGCVLFFCLTGGQHPFGDSFERDLNIVNNQKDLFLIDNIPEAMDLISHLLDPDPNLRPKAVDVLHHPLFWNAEMRLSFLRDASDRVELEDRESESELLNALESIAPVALGGKWDEKMESAFISDIGRYRRYMFDSVRDLLRVIRNKLNHYRELPQEIQRILGQIPEGFDSYFSSRFPQLLIEVYKVIHSYCGEEEFLHKYFRSNQT